MTGEATLRTVWRTVPGRQFAALVVVTLLGCGAVLAFDSVSELAPADDGASPVDGNGESPPVDVAGRTGGEIVVTAEGWPECLNPVLERCADPWLDRTVIHHVLPKLMELDADGAHVASPLLLEAPTVANGGITEDPFRVTFRLDPDARWSDGTPITAADVAFTWQARLQTPGARDDPGYEAIESIDTTDPTAPVLTFGEPYAPWADLFGGERGYLLPATAFLSSDVSDELEDSMDISGGPWLLDAWDDDTAVLVPNPAYWDRDRIPRLDRVTVVHRDLESDDPADLLDGAAAAYRPTVADVERTEASTSIDTTVARSPSYEAIWLHQDGALADRAVREAFMLAVSRQLLLAEVVRPRFPEIPLLQCVAWVPTIGRWCSESDFAAFTFDPERARAVLLDAGYVRGLDGIFVSPEGERLSLRWTTVGSDTNGQLVRAIATVQAWEVGIEILAVDVADTPTLDARVRSGDYDIAQLRATAAADPSVRERFACDAAPGSDGGGPGENVTRWCDPDADALMAEIDRTVDPSQRRELVRRLADAIDADRVALPLWQRSAVTMWHTDSVAGPVDEFTGSPYGAYWNLWAWQLPDAAAPGEG